MDLIRKHWLILAAAFVAYRAWLVRDTKVPITFALTRLDLWTRTELATAWLNNQPYIQIPLPTPDPLGIRVETTEGTIYAL